MARQVRRVVRQRRTTQWLPNITQLTVSTVVTTGTIATPILHTEAQILTLGRKPTFTRFIGHLDVFGRGSAETVVHCAMVIGPNLETASFNPTLADDLEMSLVVWQKQFLLDTGGTAPVGQEGVVMCMDLDIKAQRIMRANWDIVMVIEPNGASIDFVVGGRSLFRLA